ncbi:MAG: chromosome partitioning protein ParA [Chlamydiae bacterium CG10_big_fil_rev_8_21_14_0_10_35_9]|nr:MAG: chromosome partitioning protein ParA [Chlamydiae bacterium CG10_big_fil_rev_8_21_14_0_10_35_9]
MQIIAVSSFKGGTAKTSTSLHIGSALVKFHKKKVLLIDFDAQANLTTGLGFDPDEQDSMAPVLQGEKHVEDVIMPTCLNNLDIVPADTWLERVEVTGALAADRYSHERLKEILNPLEYDYIFIDTPPSLCWLTESALIAASYSLVCVTPEFYSIKGLQRLALFMNNISERHALNVIGVCLSFWNKRGKSNNAFLEVIEQTFPGKLLQSKVRRDISVSEASIYGKPIFETAPQSRASQDYMALTKEILERM